MTGVRGGVVRGRCGYTWWGWGFIRIGGGVGKGRGIRGCWWVWRGGGVMVVTDGMIVVVGWVMEVVDIWYVRWWSFENRCEE